MSSSIGSTALLALGSAWFLTACAPDRQSITSPNLEVEVASLNECDGGWGQLSAGLGDLKPLTTPPPGSEPHQLGTVVVYGSPVQRPNRGYGGAGTYGGVTTVYTYDRDLLAECSFGTDRTFEDLGPVEPPPSPLPIDMRPGIDTVLWAQLSEPERRTIDRLADLFTRLA
jgi:hypothetical protein